MLLRLLDNEIKHINRLADRTAIFTAARLAEEAFAFIVAREMPAVDGLAAAASN